MDPSTQRMLERARARRQKLAAQLSDADHALPPTRYPLQENQTRLLKVTTAVEVTVSNKPEAVEEINVHPTELHFSGKEYKENEQSNEIQTDVGASGNGAMREGVRSQLKRLGALYSDSQISSPIHSTESNFIAEPKEEVKLEKPTARVARLAALANAISQWEDDLSHPQLGRSTTNEIKNRESPTRPVAESSTETARADSKQSRFVKRNKAEAPKRVVWDAATLETLDNEDCVGPSGKIASNCSETESRKLTCHESELSSHHSLKSKTNQQESDGPRDDCVNECNVAGKDLHPPEESVFEKTGAGLHRTHEAQKAVVNLHRSVVGGSPKTGNVLHKATIFEPSTSPSKRPLKDPAELSVSERLALFERHKGQALVPKAPFSMAVPKKYLMKDDVKHSPDNGKSSGGSVLQGAKGGCPKTVHKSPVEWASPKQMQTNIVLAHRQLFESAAAAKNENPANGGIHSERQKDMEMLLNRWNKNKEIASSAVCDQNDKRPKLSQREGGEDQETTEVVHRTQKATRNAVSPPPQALYGSPKKKSPSSVTQVTTPKKPVQQNWTTGLIQKENKITKKNIGGELAQYPCLYDVKKIKVSPPKPGCLYPCLSDLEAATTETESELPEDEEEEGRSADSSEEMDSSSNMDSSFGREILQAAGLHKSPSISRTSTPGSSDSDLSDMESNVMDEMDDFLEEAMVDSSSSEMGRDGPTPPKRTKDIYSPNKARKSPEKRSSPSTQSQSFRYTHKPFSSPNKHLPTHVVEGEHEVPLMHTVSFYRRQQNASAKGTPVRHVVRQPEISLLAKNDTHPVQDDNSAVRQKITALLEEVSKQQTVISQASQALNLCCATVEFSGSAEQVEGERLLLLATHKRQAALHEIQRLKVEGTLKPATESVQAVNHIDKGTLTITDIVLPLKKEYVRHMPTDDMCHHFVCLLRSQDQVLTTAVLAAVPGNLHQGHSLLWNSSLRLTNLYSDFKATLEVYSLQTLREILPHDVKYHINSKKDTSKLRLTPKKLLKQESRLVMPAVQSPAGPSAVRSPSFHLAGYVVFSLREVSRAHFTLNKVAYTSPLEGSIQVKMNSELSLDVTERGFLTMFEDVSGFGAWHRRWCVLRGSILAYWKYPDDEKKKVPNGQIDLNTCITEVVGLVSRDICARPHTFLLEMARPVQADDEDSLVLVKHKDHTMIRHLLSADTREERITWCGQINKALCMLRAWCNKTKR